LRLDRARVVSEKSLLSIEELKEAIAKSFKTDRINIAKMWIEGFLGDNFKIALNQDFHIHIFQFPVRNRVFTQQLKELLQST